MKTLKPFFYQGFFSESPFFSNEYLQKQKVDPQMKHISTLNLLSYERPTSDLNQYIFSLKKLKTLLHPVRFWHSHTRGRTASQLHWTGTRAAIVMCTDIAMVTSLLLSLWQIPTAPEHNTQPESGRYSHTYTYTRFLQMLLCEWHLFPKCVSFLPVQEANPVKHGSLCVVKQMSTNNMQ